MNIIWFIMIMLGIITALFTGQLESINEVILKDASEAVSFAIGLTGIMAMWLGLMNIAKKSGLIYQFSRIVAPIMKTLFPSIPANHPAMGAIVMNMVANMFGAGNSATALGIKAMEEMQSLNKDKKRASNAMCMFLIINMSSIQLIPLTVIKIRSDAEAIMPTEIIGTSLIATTISTIVGIIVCKICEGSERL